ncbi:MAG: bifunctional diguanylate cyclase/phosphodiesterase [Pseudomonadota bacterium]
MTWQFPNRTLGFLAAGLLALTIPIYCINLGITALLDHRVKDSIMKDAEAKALSWARNLVVNIPSIKNIVRTGQATPEERSRIVDAIAVAGVFRFQLFTQEGKLAFVSDRDKSGRSDTATAIDRTHAKTAFQSKSPLVFIKTGQSNPTRPNHYVEAFVPAYASNGSVFGVIEVYIDVSDTYEALATSFAQLSWLLIVGSAIIFLVPASLVAIRSWQLSAKDRKLIQVDQIDYLTGILNRKTISAHLSKLFSSKKTAAENGILFVDVDYFKQINDNHGHHTGDLLLKHVARTITDSIRSKNDVVGRFGGDEFVVVCRDTSEAELTAIGERIVQAMRVPFRNGGSSINVSVSIGAHLTNESDDQQSALHAADLAVYEAKRRGRDQFVLHYDDLDITFKRRLYISECLSKAIADDLLRLDFQPIFNAKGEELLGFEALLRLRGRDGEIIPPNEFIPIAEETGQIECIGIWVLNRSIETASNWPRHLFVSINLSVAQFKSDVFALEVAKSLNRFAFDPHRLELEVTESLFIEDKEEVKSRFGLFKQLGVSLVLDDFGSGYSNLGYLWNFGFQKIKIDRSLLDRPESDSEKTRAMFRAIVIIADQLGASVLVEGVETEEQLAMVAACHLDQAQGFYLGRPTLEHDLSEAYDLGDSSVYKLTPSAA